jgi:hypothetical protein
MATILADETLDGLAILDGTIDEISLDNSSDVLRPLSLFFKVFYHFFKFLATQFS